MAQAPPPPEGLDPVEAYNKGLEEGSWQDYNELSAAQQYAVTQAYLVRTAYMREARVNKLYTETSLSSQQQDANLAATCADRARMLRQKKVINIKSTSGGDAGFLNRLHWVRGSEKVLNLTPAQLSELVPEVRLYKVVYDKEGAEAEHVEFKFPSSTDTNMLSSGTDIGFGLKAFTYKYIGSNPATVRNDIEAKLVLYFQNFGELLRERKSSAGTPYKFLELFSRATRIQDGTDIVTDNPKPKMATLAQTGSGALTPTAQEYQGNAAVGDNCEDDITSPRVYKGPVAFELKIEVGYGIPPNSTLYSASEWAEVKDALDNARQNFFLTLIDHDFSFGQDGTFTLDLNYRARLAGVLETPTADILRLEQAGTALGFEDRAATLTWLTDAGLATVFEGTVPEIVARLNHDMKQAKACCDTEKRDFIQRRLDRLEDAIRSTKYQTISKALLANGLMKNRQTDAATLKHWANNAGVVAAKMHAGRAVISSNKWTVLSEDSGLAEEGLAQVTVSLDSAASEQEDQTDKGKWQSIKDYVTGTYEEMVDDIPDTRLQAWELLTLPENQVVGGAGPSGNTGIDAKMTINVPFFALGDLLNIVMQMATREGEDLTAEEGERITLLLGTLKIVGETNKETIHCIADCPISWFSFRNFWYEKVIKPRRTKYPAIQFIRDILRDLVFGALNSPYWTSDGKRSRSKFRLNQAFLDLPSTPVQGFENPLLLEVAEQGNKAWSALDLDSLSPESPMFQVGSHGQPPESTHQFYVVCVKGGGTDQFKRKNIYNSDGSLVDQNILSRSQYNQEKLNIANFGFGEERGMFIEANFSKTDLPYRRESRYLEAGNSMYAQLSNVYDVEVKMFGNPFFYPGMYIFVNPFGLSKTDDPELSIGRPDQAGTKGIEVEVEDYTRSSISNLMGLGGYFVITEVTGEVVDSQYRVTVKATHDNTGSNFDDGADHPGVEDKCPEENE